MKLAYKRAYIRNKVEGHYYFKAMKNIQIGRLKSITGKNCCMLYIKICIRIVHVMRNNDKI